MADTNNASQAEEEALPPLSPAEFRQYNKLAEHMAQFHNHFRLEFRSLQSACTARKLPARTTARQFIARGLSLIEYLELHHTIEEGSVFPRLATRMPGFRKGSEMIGQHKEIHKGLDTLKAYLEACRCGDEDLDLTECGKKLEGWGQVLFKHLDEEERMLGAEVMRTYWKVEELAGLGLGF